VALGGGARARQHDLADREAAAVRVAGAEHTGRCRPHLARGDTVVLTENDSNYSEITINTV
jgi:hypothetical protein